MKGMKIKSLIVLAGLCLLFMTSCSEQQKFTKSIKGDWWPVHASGSVDNSIYSAQWNGDLGEHGEILVSFVFKSDPSKVTKEYVFYPALSFGKDNRNNDAVRKADISSREIKASKYLQYKVEKGIFYLEKTNENGTPTGEFDEGRPYKFIDENTLQIGTVTYESYTYYRQTHRNSMTELGDDSGLIPIFVYED